MARRRDRKVLKTEHRKNGVCLAVAHRLSLSYLMDALINDRKEMKYVGQANLWHLLTERKL